jgi:hypothetical protein
MLPALNEPDVTVKIRFAELAAFVSIPTIVVGFAGPWLEPLNVVAVAANGENISVSELVVVVAPKAIAIPLASADEFALTLTELE